ncbi:MAG: hypothetical protein HY815_06620, partial [Candidatus Riflebacteria bacterium]|nr:hypothetical protein [Candidatus Riflebacteria bacterium]
WREDFEGLLDVGDLYYDLGKIHHALIVSGEVIRANQFEVVLEGSSVTYEFRIRSHLWEFLGLFERFIVSSGWDLSRVRLMSALIFLNIAPLHHSPYNHLLFFLGKRRLMQVLEGEWKT